MPNSDAASLCSPATSHAFADHQPGEGSAPMFESEGNAGELHQEIQADAEHSAGPFHLTDNFGHRISDNQIH